LQYEVVAIHDDHLTDQTLGFVESFFARDVERRMAERRADDTDLDRSLCVGMRETAEGNCGAEQESDSY
jgi:hypothetical protein